MPLPAGVQTTTLTFGNDIDFAGNPIAVTVSVTPTHDIVWKATGQRVLASTMTATATAGSGGSVTVPVVDQAGWADGNGNDFTFWAYNISAAYAGQETITKAWQPLTGQTTVDFDLLTTGTVTPFVSAPTGTVTSIDGQTGAVVTGTNTVNTVAASGAALTLPAPTVASKSLVTLTANCTITLPTPIAAKQLAVWLKQDGTGGRTVTWAAPGGVTLRWAGHTAPTLTTTANATDVITFAAVTATTWDGFPAGLDMG